MIDEARYLRAGERVEFTVGKRSVRGSVRTFKLVACAEGDEEQVLTILGDDAQVYERVPGAACRPLGGRVAQEIAPPAAGGRPSFDREGALRAPAPGPASVDLLAVAARATGSQHGATLVSIRELRALALGYIEVRAALVNCALNDRTAGYAPDEPRATDGTIPALGECWMTPRELAELVLGKVTP